MSDDPKLPPMSRRSLELLFLLTDNFRDLTTTGSVIHYHHFADIAPAFCKRKNISAALVLLAPILRMYGFYVTGVRDVGYICHKSLYHVPDKFDLKFHGAKKIDERLK